MKIYTINILEQFVQSSCLKTEYSTTTSTHQTAYFSRKKAICVAKRLFEQLKKKNFSEKDIKKLVIDESKGNFTLKTTEQDFLAVNIVKVEVKNTRPRLSNNKI